MSPIATDNKLAQTFDFVNTQVNTQLSLFSNSLTPHSNTLPTEIRGNREKVWKDTTYYGVSASYRILTKGDFRKREVYVWDCLEYMVGLTPAQSRVVMRLLRYWIYYGQVYPKERQVTEGINERPIPNSMDEWYKASSPSSPILCSKATFWRTIRLLKARGLITVINRHLTPYRRQISNLYRFDKLLILIARYLAEHIAHIWPKWIKPYLTLPGSVFWRVIWEENPVLLPSPGEIAAPTPP